MEEHTRKKKTSVLIVCLLIILLAIGAAAAHLIIKYTPTSKKMDLNEYFGQPPEGEAVLILGTKKMETNALIFGEKVYLPIEIIHTYLNQRYYWDQENQEILYATPTELTHTAASTEPGSEVYVKDGAVFIEQEFIKKYTDIDIYKNENPDRVAVQYRFRNLNLVTAMGNARIRYRGGIKAEVLTEVAAGETLLLLEELEDWSRVATMDGYVGYVEKKRLSTPEIISLDRTFEREPYQYLTMEDKVNLVWHQVTTYDANEYLINAVQDMTGVNVISPTWFTMSDNEGNIEGHASAAYVEQAHAMGLKVWGLIDNFSPNMSTTEVLSRTSSRTRLIQNMIDAALEVGMDGINVDFETLSEEAGVHFLEFLRELSIECHKNNLVLSVDNPVPEDFTSHYDRAEQGRVVDYVIVMGYDEHYSGSEFAGSVASLPWVEKGITDTLEEVPAERVILGMPFYTRIWKHSGGILSSEALGMDAAKDTLSSYKAETYWNSDVSQYYGSFELEGDTYEVWLEDVESIAEKTRLVPKYSLAGVACWKLGLENHEVWKVISDHLDAEQEES